MMKVEGQLGELRMVITIKRAATGAEETYTLVGRATPEQVRQVVHHGASGAVVGESGRIATEDEA